MSFKFRVWGYNALYVCMYVYIYFYVSVYTYRYGYIGKCVYIYVYVYVYMYMYISAIVFRCRVEVLVYGFRVQESLPDAKHHSLALDLRAWLNDLYPDPKSMLNNGSL